MKNGISQYQKGGNYDELMLAFNGGQQWAFDKVFDLLYYHIYHFAVSIIGDYGDYEAAHDIALKAMEKVFSKHSGFVNINAVRSYLFLTVKNKCISFRDYQKRHRHERGLLSEAYHISTPIEEIAEAQLVRAEYLMNIYSAIEKLPPIRRKVFKMLYIEDCTIAEICAKLKMKATAVYVNKNKALKDLRNILLR